jgi:uncharacterized protein DUF1844
MSNQNTEQGEKPQLFVDEDWKGRVEAEKQAAAKRTAGSQQAAETPAPNRTSAAVESGESEAVAPLPPATLSFLVTTLATQAMVSLGEVPNPFSGKTEIRLAEARHFIDALAMLEEKTEGNRTPEESALLRGFLYQLRLSYVEAQKSPTAKT